MVSQKIAWQFRLAKKNERWVPNMDEHLKKVTNEFITQRVSHYGKNETEAVNGAYMNLRDCVERLREWGRLAVRVIGNNIHKGEVANENPINHPGKRPGKHTGVEM
jgi:hypothetical protein